MVKQWLGKCVKEYKKGEEKLLLENYSSYMRYLGLTTGATFQLRSCLEKLS
jgi:hypothetical protein